jgi:hypothetical protein
MGARGEARRVAQAEPMVVREVRRMVAREGENRAPARTFCFGTVMAIRKGKCEKGTLAYPDNAAGY